MKQDKLVRFIICTVVLILLSIVMFSVFSVNIKAMIESANNEDAAESIAVAFAGSLVLVLLILLLGALIILDIIFLFISLNLLKSTTKWIKITGIVLPSLFGLEIILEVIKIIVSLV